MPYYAKLYNQQTGKWVKREFRTLTICRKACYNNVMNTDAYVIPITKSREGKTVIGTVDQENNGGGSFVTYSSYGNPDYGKYVLNKNGTKGPLLNRNQNYNRRLVLDD